MNVLRKKFLFFFYSNSIELRKEEMEKFAEEIQALCFKKEWSMLSLSECLTSPLKEEKTFYYYQPHSSKEDLFEKVLKNLEVREEGIFAVYLGCDRGVLGTGVCITLFRLDGK